MIYCCLPVVIMQKIIVYNVLVLKKKNLRFFWLSEVHWSVKAPWILSYRSCSIMENVRKYCYILSSSLSTWFYIFFILPVWIFLSCKRALYTSFQCCSRFVSSMKIFYVFLTKIFIFSLQLDLTLSNPIFLPTTYSPVLGGKEVGGLLVIILQF
jgi:hypothetical protein